MDYKDKEIPHLIREKYIRIGEQFLRDIENVHFDVKVKVESDYCCDNGSFHDDHLCQKERDCVCPKDIGHTEDTSCIDTTESTGTLIATAGEDISKLDAIAIDKKTGLARRALASDDNCNKLFI